MTLPDGQAAYFPNHVQRQVGPREGMGLEFPWCCLAKKGKAVLDNGSILK
jgi:hypothetical protein